MDEQENKQLHLFVSYSHSDQRWLDRLKIHLTPLAQDYDLDNWDDKRLKAGTKWREEIRKAVDRADAAVLIISADFLASEFIRNNELPPLLKAAEEEGVLLLPIIAKPSLFLLKPEISQFQAVNDPAEPLISMSEGQQESTFVRVAEALFERIAMGRAREAGTAAKTQLTTDEDFLEHRVWNRLIKLGDWIIDEDGGRIIGSGQHKFLLSREEYGETPFQIQTDLEFSNFHYPTENTLGMNSGIVFGWKSESASYRYHNVLLTGDELLLERVGFKGGSEAEHITDWCPARIESGKSHAFVLKFNQQEIQVYLDGKHIKTLDRPTGVVGRVGLRPWRSKMDCTRFVVST